MHFDPVSPEESRGGAYPGAKEAPKIVTAGTL
jgi:hypothetical protein